jgi:hypothetical protein
MPAIATHADALRVQLSGQETLPFAQVGTLPGVQVLTVGAQNGPGQGVLSIDAAQNVSWQPPGATGPGQAVNVSAGGGFLLEGPDPSQWIRISVQSDYLTASFEAAVCIADTYGRLLGDINATLALSGGSDIWTFVLENDSPNSATSVRIWLDPDADMSGITISLDGVSWSSPQSESAAIIVNSIAAGSSASIYLKRTIAAASPSNPARLLLVHFSFFSF